MTRVRTLAPSPTNPERSVPPRIATLTVLLALATPACGSEGRPTADEWRPRWEETRSIVPDAATLQEDGPDACGDLLGEARRRREDLLPTPGEPTDDDFRTWVEQVEALGLDCVDDTTDLDERLTTIDRLADQVDLSLAGE